MCQKSGGFGDFPPSSLLGEVTAGGAARWDSARDRSPMPRSASAGRTPAPTQPSPGPSDQGQLSSQIQRKTVFVQFFILFCFVSVDFLLCFFKATGQRKKKSDCCEQRPCKLVTRDRHCLRHLQVPALPGAGSELGTIPKGRTMGPPALCDLFLHHHGLPAGAPPVPGCGCTGKGDKGQQERGRGAHPTHS